MGGRVDRAGCTVCGSLLDTRTLQIVCGVRLVLQRYQPLRYKAFILDIAPFGDQLPMPTQNSPYKAFATLLASGGHPVSPAELHGMLLGRSCAGAGFDTESWFADASILLETEPQDNVRQALVGLQEMVKGELTSDDMTVVLLLPGDDEPLTERAAALGQWCQGFLSGFGLAAGDRVISPEATEVLQDLAAIAQVQDALEESEDGESDYMEVMEYLRVAPLLLFTECAKASAAPVAEAKPSLH